MNIDDLTIREAREIASMFHGGAGPPCAQTHSLTVGQAVFIRTVTMAYTGRIESITDTDIVLSDAAWIPVTARFNDMLLAGDLDEVEPYPAGVIVMRGAIVDVAKWSHQLPREQK